MRTRMHSTGTERARFGTQQSALTTLQELKKTIEQWEREREEVGVLVAQLKENMESKAAKLKDMARLNMQHIMQHLMLHLMQRAPIDCALLPFPEGSCCSRLLQRCFASQYEAAPFTRFVLYCAAMLLYCRGCDACTRPRRVGVGCCAGGAADRVRRATAAESGDG